MSERAKEFMNLVWEARNNGADTEEQLVSAILTIASENIRFYNAQNELVVLDKNDLLQLAEEIKNETD
jgi:hypothetical protein